MFSLARTAQNLGVLLCARRRLLCSLRLGFAGTHDSRFAHGYHLSRVVNRQRFTARSASVFSGWGKVEVLCPGNRPHPGTLEALIREGLRSANSRQSLLPQPNPRAARLPFVPLLSTR